MNTEQMAQQAAQINFEMLALGVPPSIGFEWRDTSIHDRFSDPQYGAFRLTRRLSTETPTSTASSLPNRRRPWRRRGGS